MSASRGRFIPNYLSVLVLMLSAWGCASPLPTYPRMRDDDAARIIGDRLATIHMFSARCEITMTNSQGDSVRLDGALVAASPDRLRMRAWKFGRAVSI